MKKLIITILVLAFVGAAGYFGYQFYSKVKVDKLEAFDAIPDNASFVLKFDHVQTFVSERVSGEINALAPVEQMNGVGDLLVKTDSLLKAFEVSQPTLYAYIQNSELYYSVHMNGVDNFAALWTVQMKPPVDFDEILNQIKLFASVKTRDFEEDKIWEVTLNGTHDVFHIVNKGNLMMISSLPVLIEKVIYTIQSGKRYSEDPLIQKMKKIEGNDNAFTLYLNYSYFYRFLGKYGDPVYRDVLKHLRDIARFAVLDVSVEESLLRFNGFSVSDDSSATFATSLNDLAPGTFTAQAVLPYHASGFIWFGAEDYRAFYDKMSDVWPMHDDNELKKWSEKLGEPLEDYFYPWMRKELMIAYGSGSKAKMSSESLVFMRVTDIKEALQRLADLKSKSDSPQDTLMYRNYQLHQINIPYLLPTVFGSLFKAMEQSWYVAIEEYVVFANSEEVLQDYLNDYMVGKNLAMNPNFKEISENISTDAHLMFYLDVSQYRNVWADFLSLDVVKAFEKSSLPLDAYGSFLIELQSDRDACYTNALLSTRSESAVEDAIGWQTALDADVAWGPYSVKNHLTGHTDIMVADKHNFLYRIDHRGQIEWKIPLLGKPLGKITELDMYENDKYQTLFNTTKFIYLLDVNGNKVDNYPVKLALDATAGLNLIRYSGSDKTRLLIPLADKKVYNFQLDGTETKGWMYPSMETIIEQEVQYFDLNGKDIILIADTSGNVVYANRRGENRIQTKLGFTNYSDSRFYQVQHKGEHKLLTTDPLGRVVLINFKGEVEKIMVDEFSNHHKFSLYDYDQDGVKDYVFMDYNKIIVYGEDKRKIFEKALEFVPAGKDIALVQYHDSTLNVVYNSENKQLYFMSPSGKIEENELYTSTGKYFLEKATKNSKLRLITVNGNVISNYIL